jgi:hypothetical protein
MYFLCIAVRLIMYTGIPVERVAGTQTVYMQCTMSRVADEREAPAGVAHARARTNAYRTYCVVLCIWNSTRRIAVSLTQ